MISAPFPFHPNWNKEGLWCHGTWIISEGLGHNVVRMIRTLQFDLEITNEGSPANWDAKNWYSQHKNSGLFPCDRQVLPDPTATAAATAKRFVITGQTPAPPRFRIQN